MASDNSAAHPAFSNVLLIARMCAVTSSLVNSDKSMLLTDRLENLGKTGIGSCFDESLCGDLTMLLKREKQKP